MADKVENVIGTLVLKKVSGMDKRQRQALADWLKMQAKQVTSKDASNYASTYTAKFYW